MAHRVAAGRRRYIYAKTKKAVADKLREWLSDGRADLDLGKEYSSLSYLRQLPLDALKIDDSFVESLGTNPTNRTIVETLISLTHSLGIEVTGEGVESAEQLERLRRMGCDLVQGFHLARPPPSKEVESLLADRSTP